MIEVILTQGQIALIDDDMCDLVLQYNWYALWDESISSYYARANAKDQNGKPIKISMHRLILGLEHGDSRIGDHINHNTLDNRLENLRVADKYDSARNQRKHQNNTSGYIGVSWNKRREKWVAQISINGKRTHLITCDSAYEAAQAYNEAALQYYGEFAVLNDI